MCPDVCDVLTLLAIIFFAKDSFSLSATGVRTGRYEGRGGPSAGAAGSPSRRGNFTASASAGWTVVICLRSPEKLEIESKLHHQI